MLCVSLSWQIRVVNAFRMGLDGADSFEKRSLSSVHSHLSLYALRWAAEQKRSTPAFDDTTVSSPEDVFPRV